MGKFMGWTAKGRFGYFSPSLALPLCQSHKGMPVASSGSEGYDSMSFHPSTGHGLSACLPQVVTIRVELAMYFPTSIFIPSSCLFSLLQVYQIFRVFCMMSNYLKIISYFDFILWLISVICLTWNWVNGSGHACPLEVKNKIIISLSSKTTSLVWAHFIFCTFKKII